MCEYWLNISRICFSCFGKKPINAKSSPSFGSCETNVVTALAPASDVIFMLCSFNSFISTHPGSEISGVPASETSAIVFPSSMSLRIPSVDSFSLNLW